jgi:membrane protease YdiL (CAAX protease family)
VLLPVIGLGTVLVLSLFDQSVAWEYGVPPILIVPVGLLIFFLNSLPEEYGWRGFALDHLQQRWGALTSSLISSTTQAVIPIWEFVLQMIVLAVLYTWLYNNTGRSVLIAVLFHTVGNLTGAVIPFWTTEAGRWANFVILLVVAVIVVWVWKPTRLIRVE